MSGAYVQCTPPEAEALRDFVLGIRTGADARKIAVRLATRLAEEVSAPRARWPWPDPWEESRTVPGVWNRWYRSENNELSIAVTSRGTVVDGTGEGVGSPVPGHEPVTCAADAAACDALLARVCSGIDPYELPEGLAVK